MKNEKIKMNVDRGLRPLENWVCGAVERGGRPGVSHMVFVLQNLTVFRFFRKRPRLVHA